MHESDYIRSVNKHLDPKVYVWKINDNYAGGVPDCWYCGPAGNIWVEFKLIRSLPKRSATLILPALTTQQRLWLCERRNQGVNTAVIVGSPVGAVVLQSPEEWLKGVSTDQFKLRALDRKTTARWLNAQVGVQLNATEHHVPRSSECASSTQALGR